jgi:primosomal protein N'
MLHSSLRVAERYDQWKRIRRGEVRVVLGTRSAIFAPLKNLGAIILDEEQESSYQSENPPRYHTRDIAKYLCARDKAVLVLGSATPTVETNWAAEQGIYKKFILRKRYNEQALPNVTIADLREEIPYKEKKLLFASAKIRLFGNRVEIDTDEKLVFTFDEASALTMLGRNKLNIYHGGRIYQLKGDKRFCALKFVNIYHRYKNIQKGDEHDLFLGI